MFAHRTVSVILALQVCHNSAYAVCILVDSLCPVLLGDQVVEGLRLVCGRATNIVFRSGPHPEMEVPCGSTVSVRLPRATE